MAGSADVAVEDVVLKPKPGALRSATCGLHSPATLAAVGTDVVTMAVPVTASKLCQFSEVGAHHSDASFDDTMSAHDAVQLAPATPVQLSYTSVAVTLSVKVPANVGDSFGAGLAVAFNHSTVWLAANVNDSAMH